MKTVFVLLAVVDYDGSLALCCFADKEEAEELAKLCDTYERDKPPFPDDDAPDSEWEKYSDTWDEWRANHPGGENAYGADHYDVVELPFNA